MWDSWTQNNTSGISTKCLSEFMGLLRAGQAVGNLNKTCTFRNCGTTVRKTKRRKYQDMHFQNFWDSCAQSKSVGNLPKLDFQTFWDSCAQNETS